MTKQDLAAQYGAGIRTVRFTITYKDLQLTSGSGAKSITIADQNNPTNSFTLPAGSKIMGVVVKQSVAFSGGSLSAMTVSLGVSGATTRFTSAYDIFAAVADTTLQETAMFKSGQGSTISALLATFTPTGDTCASCTAGSVDITITYFENTSTGAGLPA